MEFFNYIHSKYTGILETFCKRIGIKTISEPTIGRIIHNKFCDPPNLIQCWRLKIKWFRPQKSPAARK